jgi:hypothetical protein
MWKPAKSFSILTSNTTRPNWYRQAIPQDAPPKRKTNPKKTEPIVHIEEEKAGAESAANKRAMRQFEKIYAWILQETAKKLGKINDAVSKRGVGYTAAVDDFNDFVDGINDQDPASKHNGPTMLWAVIEPVMDEKFIIVGAVVKVKWLGGTHSSSSGIAIPH